MEDKKRLIPVPAEKALKGFHVFLTSVRSEMVTVPMVVRGDDDEDANTTKAGERQAMIVEQLKSLGAVLTKHVELEDSNNHREQELVELLECALDDFGKDCKAAQNRWVDLLLDKVSDILDSMQFVNLEKLTNLMEKNDIAGNCMEGKDVILLLGSPGAGKTTVCQYLAGTTFQLVMKENNSFFQPVEFEGDDAVLADMKISLGGGKEVITRHLQTATVTLDGKSIVLCDTPSFGNHETIEEVIANSLGLVRAVQKAKTVRPVFVLSRDEIGFRDHFNAHPQILAILARLLGTESNVDLEPFNFIFTKYNWNNANCLRKQFSTFLKQDKGATDSTTGGKREANKQALIKLLIKRSTPEANIIVPNKGVPEEMLRQLLDGTAFVENPDTFFVPNLSDDILSTLKKQLKGTLIDLRDSLSADDNATGIHRMQQMSKLANLLPEAGIYARHGFKAFKEIINQMVEDEEDEDTDSSPSSGVVEDIFPAESTESRGSITSSESELRGNLSSKRFAVKGNSNGDLLASRILSPVSEELLDLDDRDTAEDKEQGSEVLHNQLNDPEGKYSPDPSRALLDELMARSKSHPSLLRSFSEGDEELLLGEEGEALLLKHLEEEEEETSSTTDSDGSDRGSEYQKNEEEEQEVEEGDDADDEKEDEHNNDHDEQSKDVIDLPEEERVYAEQYSTLLKEMTFKAVEEEDYCSAIQRMHEFMRLARSNPERIRDHPNFKKCVELFLVFSVALRTSDYRTCLEKMNQLIALSEAGCIEAQKCSECGVNIAIKHIVELRDRVIELTSQLHHIADPDEFDRVAEQLRVVRNKVENSNMLLETCMRGSNDRGKSETVLACISYGFKVGRLSR